MNCVGCHVYAGGFSEGCRKAGFDVELHCEAGPFGVETFLANFPRAKASVGFSSWPSPRCDLLIANPPCAPFSTAGSHKNLADPRLACWAEVFSLFVRCEPTVFIGESVQGMYRRGFPFVAEMAKACLALGYEVHFVLHDAKFLGLPQQRRRFFFVASRCRMRWPPPVCARVTIRDALAGLEDPGHFGGMKPEYAALWSLGHGAVRRGMDIIGKEAWSTAGFRIPRMGTTRLRWDSIVGTVFGNTMMHPDEPRFLGVNEYKRLMGFPDGWTFAGADKPISLMVKGVTPNCGEYAGRVAADAIRRAELPRPACFERVVCASSHEKNDFDMLDLEREVTGDVMHV